MHPRLSSCIGAALLGLSLLAWSAEDIGTIKTLSGQVHIVRGGQMFAATVGSTLQASDHLRTHEASSVGITLRDNTLLTAGAHAVLSLNRFAYDPVTHDGALDVTVTRGTLAVVSGKIAKTRPDAVRFRTPTITLGVRGTEFIIDVSEQQD